MSQAVKSKLAPEKVLELCNAINAAVHAGKIVTLDDSVVTIQVGGAIPGFILNQNIHCIRNVPVVDDTVHVINTEGYIIRAYRPTETTVEILHNPHEDNIYIPVFRIWVHCTASRKSNITKTIRGYDADK